MEKLLQPPQYTATNTSSSSPSSSTDTLAKEPIKPPTEPEATNNDEAFHRSAPIAAGLLMAAQKIQEQNQTRFGCKANFLTHFFMNTKSIRNHDWKAPGAERTGSKVADYGLQKILATKGVFTLKFVW